MPTSLEHGKKYRCRKVNKGHHTLEMRTNGTRHDIPNITHLREKWGRKEGGFKRVHNPKGKARTLNLLNIIAQLICTCLNPCPFCLRLGDRALTPYVLAPCIYMQRQRQETSRQAVEGKDARSIWKRHKANKHDRHGKQRNKKASKQARRQTSKKANRRWCPRGTNVGLDQMSIISLCWSMDNTLASKTHAWTYKQACKDA